MADVGGAQSKRTPRPPRGKECGVENCGALTKNEKPYCHDHMDLMKRANSIMSENVARRDEMQRVLDAGFDGWKRVNVDGSIAREIVEVINMFGAQTMPQLRKIVQIKHEVLGPYVKALVHHGRLRVTPQHCGGRTLTEVVSIPAG